MGWPHYIGVKDVSSHGIRGIIMGEGKTCIPTVFRLAWPDDINEFFRKGNITNSDLEMSGLLILWLVMEEVCPKLQVAYVTLFSVAITSCKTEICLHHYPIRKRIIIPVQPDVGKEAK